MKMTLQQQIAAALALICVLSGCIAQDLSNSLVDAHLRLTNDPQDCGDTDSRCRSWALDGQCYHNRAYMHVYCRETCGQCDVIDLQCRDLHVLCPGWADRGECQRNSDFMIKTCARSCAFCLPSQDHNLPYPNPETRRRLWDQFSRTFGLARSFVR